MFKIYDFSKKQSVWSRDVKILENKFINNENTDIVSNTDNSIEISLNNNNTSNNNNNNITNINNNINRKQSRGDSAYGNGGLVSRPRRPALSGNFRPCPPFVVFRDLYKEL